MVRPNQEAVNTFISITGASESIAVHKLEEYRGDLNLAVNAYFGEEGGTGALETSTAARQEDDLMDIDDGNDQVSSRGPIFPFLPAFSLLDPNFRTTFFNGTFDFLNRTPFVSLPREIREIPIEVKDGNGPSTRTELAPTIEEVTDATRYHGPEIHGTVVLDEDDDDNYLPAGNSVLEGQNEPGGGDLFGSSLERHHWPSAPMLDDMPGNDIEEAMIRAAIEASKREAEESQPGNLDDITNAAEHIHSRPEDAELAHAVSLSLQTAEREKAVADPGIFVRIRHWEKALRKQVENFEASQPGFENAAEVEEPWRFAPSNGRQGIGFSDKSSSSHSKLGVESSSTEDVEELEEQLLVRQRPRRLAPSSIVPINEVGVGRPTSPGSTNVEQNNENAFPSEWGGLSSVERDEAVMLEAALFGGIPEESGYLANAPDPLMHSTLERTLGSYARPTPRPPSPTLTTQRLLREQQDDEFYPSLKADKEKEMKAIEEAEARRLEELLARESAHEEERRKEDEIRRKLEEEQEFERKLAAKEASLPSEPTAEDENTVTLLVRMPDGSRRGRRFLKTDKLQLLFNFIDIGKVVKSGTYRLVRPYPRRAFSDEDRDLTLNELGLTTKQEALYLELI